VSAGASASTSGEADGVLAAFKAAISKAVGSDGSVQVGSTGTKLVGDATDISLTKMASDSMPMLTKSIAGKVYVGDEAKTFMAQAPSPIWVNFNKSSESFPIDPAEAAAFAQFRSDAWFTSSSWGGDIYKTLFSTVPGAMKANLPPKTSLVFVDTASYVSAKADNPSPTLLQNIQADNAILGSGGVTKAVIAQCWQFVDILPQDGMGAVDALAQGKNVTVYLSKNFEWIAGGNFDSATEAFRYDVMSRAVYRKLVASAEDTSFAANLRVVEVD
jgi:hypothetical protein